MRFFLSIFFSIILAFTFTTACKSIEAPELKEIIRVDWKGISGSGINLDVVAKVHNPNRFKIAMLSYDLELFINDKLFGKSQSNDKRVLKKHAEDEFTFQIESEIGNLFGNALSYLSGGFDPSKPMKFRIAGTTKVKVYGVTKLLRIDYESVVKMD